MISIIFQGIIGFLAATVATFAIYWNKIKEIFKNYFNKKNENKNEKKINSQLKITNIIKKKFKYL